jgi:hypothetical protein
MRRVWRVPLLVALLAGCRTPRTVLPVDPGVTFAAHRVANGFVLDRTRSGETGSLERRGRLHEPDAPDFVLRIGDEPRAGLWVVGRTRVLVRDSLSNRAPRAAEVLSSWDGGAIRLSLLPEHGGPLQTDPFRGEGPVGGRVLTRTSSPSGTYRAIVREADGAEAGWFRVDVGSETLPRVYDAILPERVDDALAGAAATVLDAELGWIAEHGAGGD